MKVGTLKKLKSKTVISLTVVLWMMLHGAVTQAGEKIYFVHNDHLGTPQEVTDMNQNVVWQVGDSPFGADAPAVETITNNIRFPGQYYDEETGLHYNWNRYYDPEIGRYITSDPIGLQGGLNTYLYVNANPLSKIDPRGLMGSFPACFDEDILSAEECFFTPTRATALKIESTITAIGECITCNVDCVVKFFFGTDMPLAGEAYTQTAQKTLDAASKKYASELAAEGVKFVAKRVFLPLTIAGGVDAAVCTAECF